MSERTNQATSPPGTRGVMLRPRAWSHPDRHVFIAISHASNDPSLHETYKIRASYVAESDGWQAFVSRHHHNEQYGEWTPLFEEGAHVFATPAACLGFAASTLIAAFDGEAVAE